jgi:hypothetical protein
VKRGISGDGGPIVKMFPHLSGGRVVEELGLVTVVELCVDEVAGMVVVEDDRSGELQAASDSPSRATTPMTVR